MGTTQREFGEDTLTRVATWIYWVISLQFLWMLTASPGLALMLILALEPSNTPLIILAAIPLGPASAATVKSWNHFSLDRGNGPFRQFFRAYRSNIADTLKWCVPAAVLMAVLGLNIPHLQAVFDSDGLWTIALSLSILILAILVVWSGHALVISSIFRFRLRDVTRLSFYFLGKRPLASLGLISLAILAIGIAFVASDWVVVLLAAPFCLLVLRNGRTVIADVRNGFVQE